MKTIIVGDIMLIESDQLRNKWIANAGRLDHDIYVLEKLKHFLGSGHIVDVGANIGTHCSFYIKHRGADKQLFAFEPNPFAFACLSHNCPSTVRLPFALGDRVDLLPLHLNESNPGASYIGGDSAIQVPVIPLDSLRLRGISFVKIDVEGFEWHVIAGGKETISECQPPLWVELSPGHASRSGNSIETFLSLLGNLGYLPFFVYGTAEQADVMFIHREKMADSIAMARSAGVFKEFEQWLSLDHSNRMSALSAFFGA